MEYTSVVLGGTFDGLHAGHKALLGKAFSLGDHVTIGLTTDEYVNNFKFSIHNLQFIHKLSKTEKISSFLKRKQELETWLEYQGWGSRYTIVPLDDPYGPLLRLSTALGATAGKLTDFDAIVVSDQTRKTAEEMNELRKKQGLPPIRIISIPMVRSEDTGHISSTRIRNKEIDAEGRLILPVDLRRELRKPIGPIIPDGDVERVVTSDQTRVIVTVGDKTTERILHLGIRPRLSAIDFFTNRERFDWPKSLMDMLLEHREVKTLTSGPGYISGDVLTYIRQWAQICTPSLLIIDGEEDLLVLPLAMEAPDGTVIYYGQPDQGMVRVVVDERVRTSAQTLLKKFSSR